MTNTSITTPPPPPRLLDRVRNQIRLKHYNIRAEEAYVRWIKRFVCFYGQQPKLTWMQ